MHNHIIMPIPPASMDKVRELHEKASDISIWASWDSQTILSLTTLILSSEPAQDVTPVEIECFKSTPIRRMSTGGNYVNLTADVVLLTDHQSAIVQLKAERDVAANELAEINSWLLEGQGDDDGEKILPDFKEGWSVSVKIEACLFLLEFRRDVIAGAEAERKNAKWLSKSLADQLEKAEEKIMSLKLALTACQKREAGLREIKTAARAVLADWDSRMQNGKEEKKTYRPDDNSDDTHEYWSPASAMVGSEYIAELRAALSEPAQDVTPSRKDQAMSNVTVKPLEWWKPDYTNNYTHGAKTITGTYYVYIDGGRHIGCMETFVNDTIEQWEGPERGYLHEAQSDCFADYEARILSAIEVSE